LKSQLSQEISKYDSLVIEKYNLQTQRIVFWYFLR
jgi:hypothetical protein